MHCFFSPFDPHINGIFLDTILTGSDTVRFPKSQSRDKFIPCPKIQLQLCFPCRLRAQVNNFNVLLLNSSGL